MVRLVMLLLGVEYLRKRAPVLFLIGVVWTAAGLFIIIDMLDGVTYFPITFFTWLFLLEGLATLAVAWTGVGGQRALRYAKGFAVVGASALIFAGDHVGHFILSMIFGTLFLVDGLFQCVSAWVVRYPAWKASLAWGGAEIVIAVIFYQPYPTHYVGTLPYSLGIFLLFGGVNTIVLAAKARKLIGNPALRGSQLSSLLPDVELYYPAPVFDLDEWDGPPAADEHALTVHVWTPSGSSKTPTQRRLLIDRYIAAVDANGTISTGHAALESPEGIYVSLYPAAEIDRSPGEFGRLLRATRDNDVPGVFQPDYATESRAWCPSTVRVRIRNYDPGRLAAFWAAYRQDTTYNLTHRNCSSSVSNALEAAVDGAIGRLHGGNPGWGSFLRVLVTPELWVAAQIRKRAVTMAWTPGLTLDYARALSMLVDPRPFSWWKAARLTMTRLRRRRQVWHAQDAQASR